jgi:hypothetical protein
MGMAQEESMEMVIPGESQFDEVLRPLLLISSKVYGRGRSHHAWTANAICPLERLGRDSEEVLYYRPATLEL